MSQIYVKAAEGLKLPKEREPRNYIPSDRGIPVDGASHYYAKAITDGDLIQLTDKEIAAQLQADAAADAAAVAEAARIADELAAVQGKAATKAPSK